MTYSKRIAALANREAAHAELKASAMHPQIRSSSLVRAEQGVRAAEKELATLRAENEKLA